MKYLVFLTLPLLFNCSSKPYAELGVGYTFYQNTVIDGYLSRCHYPFSAEIGLEKNQHSVYVRHDSHIDCGSRVGGYDFSTNKIGYKIRLF